MRLEIDIAEHHYNNIMALDSVCLGRVPYKGIIMYSINAIKHGKVLEQEPTTRNCFGCKYAKDNHNAGTEECHLCMWENQYTSTTKNELVVDCIDRNSIKYYPGQGGYMYASKGEIDKLPSVTPQEPRKGYLSIDDVMSVFDDFMCGKVDEDGTETFLEMLKDKAESEEEE